jgi:catechol 2,3-dioxygenase-like lactoylglutathione lyase family enzyme
VLIFDHITVNVRDLEASRRFYEAALETLGFRLIVEMEGAVAFGPSREDSDFWIAENSDPTAHLHLAFTSPDRESVDAFHAAALAAGGRDNGAPGLRPRYHESYYAAYVFDPDGNNVEAVFHGFNRR